MDTLASTGNLLVLVLDEPTNGLDPENRRFVWDILLKKNRTGTIIILATHNVVEAEKVIQRVGIINQGRVIGTSSTRFPTGRREIPWKRGISIWYKEHRISG